VSSNAYAGGKVICFLVGARAHTHAHTHNRFMALLDLLWDCPSEVGKTNLDLLEQEIVSGSGICWAICKSAPHPRQITTPTYN